jgi:hypothetical protein
VKLSRWTRSTSTDAMMGVGILALAMILIAMIVLALAGD